MIGLENTKNKFDKKYKAQLKYVNINNKKRRNEETKKLSTDLEQFYLLLLLKKNTIVQSHLTLI